LHPTFATKSALFGHVPISELSLLSGAKRKLYLETSKGGYWQILLKKSFWGDEQKFLAPLMRLTGGDVRDHIASSKIDHVPP